MLEEKVIQIFEGIDLFVTASDIEDCHFLGNSGNNTIVSLVNRRICKKALENKTELNNKLDNAKLRFQSDMKIFLSRTMNERAIGISHASDIKTLYPDFVFKEKNRSK